VEYFCVKLAALAFEISCRKTDRHTDNPRFKNPSLRLSSACVATEAVTHS